MRKIKNKFLIGTIICLLLISGITKVSIASNNENIRVEEFTEQFKKYTELSEKEKKQVALPIPYKITDTNYETKNPFVMLGANITETQFSLRNIIPNNVKIRNQMSTSECWCFASLSGLETNLAMTNGDNKTYDFSERHMDYYTSKTFLNEEINEKGFNREVGNGGSYFLTTAYLTNGSGAILESDMPFENNENKIELSEVQGKKVASHVYDIKTFPTYSVVDGNTTEVRDEIKSFIKQYGSIMAQIHGASLLSEYTNNATGAMYCDSTEDCKINHAVAIIGWNDEYAIENFNEEHRPINKGAWIVRNSWGEKLEYDLTNLKRQIFNIYKRKYTRQGKTDYTMLTNEDIEQRGYTIEGDKAYLNVGDNGYMYISYEDVNVYSNLYGIQKSSENLEYNNLYQHNFYGSNAKLIYTKPKMYIGEIFNRTSTNTREYLKQVSISNPETYTCKVYVNPNGTSMKKSDLQEVKLKAGETETFESGYHTLEFETPIELKSSSFSVVVEAQSNNSNEIGVLIEYKNNNTFNQVTIDQGTSFTASEDGFNSNTWLDLSKLTEIYPNSSLLDGDATIKAFTTTSYEDTSLKEIKITKPPTKTTYTEGDDFEKAGMVVTAYYNNNTYSNIIDYDISNGTNLKPEQTSVKISYQDKTVEQEITVQKVQNSASEERKITGINISNMPNKTTYIQNKESLNLAGGTIKVSYNDNTTETIEMTSNKVTATGFSNTIIGLKTITLSYEGFSTTYTVEIVNSETSNSSEIEKTEEKVEIDVPQGEAKASNFSNAIVRINSLKNYVYTNGKNPYTLIETSIKGIQMATGNDSQDYYYYISPNASESNIQSWIKISEVNNNDNSLTFAINSNSISNYKEILAEDKIYIYIREVAVKGGNQKVTISNSMLFQKDTETAITNYLDEAIQVNQKQNSGNIPNQGLDSEKKSKSDSIEKKAVVDTKKSAPSILPYTGTRNMIFLIIIIVSIFGGVMFIKYKNRQ